MGEKIKSPKLIEDEADGLNVRLFKSLAKWSYGAVREFASINDFRDSATVIAKSLNQQFSPQSLTNSEIRKAVKSVCKWTWKKFLGGEFRSDQQSKKSLILHLENYLPVKHREQLGQIYTSQIRVERTLEKIRNSIDELTRSGKPVNQSAVARHTGMTRMTVQRYWKTLTENDNQNDNEIELPSERELSSDAVVLFDSQVISPTVDRVIDWTGGLSNGSDSERDRMSVNCHWTNCHGTNCHGTFVHQLDCGLPVAIRETDLPLVGSKSEMGLTPHAPCGPSGLRPSPHGGITYGDTMHPQLYTPQGTLRDTKQHKDTG